MKKLLFLAFMTATTFSPDLALASGNVSEFTAPLEKFVDVLGGPWIKVIAVLSITICLAALAITKAKADETVTTLIYIFIALSGVLGASSFVANFFGFSGAMIA